MIERLLRDVNEPQLLARPGDADTQPRVASLPAGPADRDRVSERLFEISAIEELEDTTDICGVATTECGSQSALPQCLRDPAS
jgi:hypothetical protein